MKAKGILKTTREKKQTGKKKLLDEKVMHMSKNKIFFHIEILISIYLNRKQWGMPKVTSRENKKTLFISQEALKSKKQTCYFIVLVHF